MCPKIIDMGGHETFSRCYYPSDYYEDLKRSLINTKVDFVGLKVYRDTPFYKYGTSGAYAGILGEEIEFISTLQIEEFPKNYTVYFDPRDTRNYKLIWRVWNLDIDIPSGNYTSCVYNFGKVKIDLKDECSKLERGEVKGNRIWFYFNAVRGEQSLNVDLVDPIKYIGKIDLDEGSSFVKSEDNKSLVIEKENKFIFNITSSTPFYYVGDVRETREWGYKATGWNTITIISQKELIIYGRDYVCIEETYDEENHYCLYFPPQLKNITVTDKDIGKHTYDINIRNITKTRKNSARVDFVGDYDPTFTSINFYKGFGNDGTQGYANSERAGSQSSYNNLSRALIYMKFESNYIREGEDGLEFQGTCRNFYDWEFGFVSGISGFGHGSNGVEVTGCDERFWLRNGTWADGDETTLSHCIGNDCDSIRYNGTWHFWIKAPTNVGTQNFPYMINLNSSLDFLKVGTENTGKLRYELRHNGTLVQNQKSVTLINDTKWHLHTLVWDASTGNVIVYIDGVEDSTPITSFTGFSGTYFTSISQMLGNDWDTTNVTMDEFIVFDYAKSSDEILADYNDFYTNFSNSSVVVFNPIIVDSPNSSFKLNWTDVDNTKLQASIRGKPKIPNLHQYWDFSWATEDSLWFNELNDTVLARIYWDDDNLVGRNVCLNYTFLFDGSPTFDPRCDGTGTTVESPTSMLIKSADENEHDDWKNDNNVNGFMVFAWVYPRSCSNGNIFNRKGERPQLLLDNRNDTDCDQFFKGENESATEKFAWGTNGGVIIREWNLYGFWKNSTGFGTISFSPTHPSGVINNQVQNSLASSMAEGYANGTGQNFGIFGAGNQFRGGDLLGGPVYFIDGVNLTLIKDIFDGVYNWTDWTDWNDSNSDFDLGEDVSYIQPRFRWGGVVNLTEYNLVSSISEEVADTSLPPLYWDLIDQDNTLGKQLIET